MKKEEQLRLMEPVMLVETADGVQADLLIATLREQGIPAYKASKNSGGMMNTYMGFSIYGAEIFVDEEDLLRAQEILAELEALAEDSDETDLDEADMFPDEDEDGEPEEFGSEDTDEEDEDEKDGQPAGLGAFQITGMELFRKFILIAVLLFVFGACWRLILSVWVLLSSR